MTKKLVPAAGVVGGRGRGREGREWQLQDQDMTRIFYNRVPKCGSVAMQRVLALLAKRTQLLRSTLLPLYDEPRLSREELVSYVKRLE